mmetsp:Transcript_6756/g.7644  ORF Transcript_6756/g.7644 Transcript_6756/m.7644 type:complete len:226 (-) Transcript_6756:21-698(-)
MSAMRGPAMAQMRQAAKAALLLLAAIWASSGSNLSFAEGAEGADRRIPLSELKVGEEMDGRVKNVHRMFGWFVDIGAARDAFLELEEACDGFPVEGMKTWRKGASMTVRILDVDLEGYAIKITKRTGPLDRPPQFRRPPSAEDVASYSDVDANDFIDTTICGMSPNGLWLRVPARGEGQDFRTLLRLDECKESVKETACLGMTVPVRVTGIDQAKNRVLVSMIDP